MLPSIITTAIALSIATAGVAHADTGEHAEMRVASHSRLGSTAAIQAATAKVKGIPYSVGVEVTRHGHWYEVMLSTNHGAVTVRVDDRDGKVIGWGPAESDDAAEAPQAAIAKVGLVQALKGVAQVHPGPVLEAGLDGRGRSLGYVVTVIEGGKAVNWRVDAHSGRLSAHPVRDTD